MEGLAGGQGNKYGGVGGVGCRDRDGELRRKEVVAGQALPLNRGTLAFAEHRQPGSLTQRCGRTDSLSSPRRSGGGEVGSLLPGPVSEPGVGAGGAEAKGEGSLALVAGVVLAGGGEPAKASQLRAAAAAGGAQRPALPLPKLGGSLPSNNPEREGLRLQSSEFRTLAHRTTPHCVHSAAVGGGRRPTPDLQAAAGGAPGPAAPPPPAPARAPSATQIAQESGPCSAAPRRTRRGAVPRIGASCAGGGRQGLREAAGGRDARATPHPAGARVGRAPGHRPLPG